MHWCHVTVEEPVSVFLWNASLKPLEGLFLFASEHIDSVLKRFTFTHVLTSMARWICNCLPFSTCLTAKSSMKSSLGRALFTHWLCEKLIDYPEIVLSLVLLDFVTQTSHFHRLTSPQMKLEAWRRASISVLYPFKASLMTQINFKLNISHWLLLKRFLWCRYCLLQIKTKHEQ